MLIGAKLFIPSIHAAFLRVLFFSGILIFHTCCLHEQWTVHNCQRSCPRIWRIEGDRFKQMHTSIVDTSTFGVAKEQIYIHIYTYSILPLSRLNRTLHRRPWFCFGVRCSSWLCFVVRSRPIVSPNLSHTYMSVYTFIYISMFVYIHITYF